MTFCRKKKITRLWLASRDSDYGVQYERKLLLNPFLLREFRMCGNDIEIHCFTSVFDAITDFSKNAGVKAEKLPTDKEAAAITKGIEALPPRNWNAGFDDANMIAVWTALRQTQYGAAIASTFESPQSPLESGKN